MEAVFWHRPTYQGVRSIVILCGLSAMGGWAGRRIVFSVTLLIAPERTSTVSRPAVLCISPVRMPVRRELGLAVGQCRQRTLEGHFASHPAKRTGVALRNSELRRQSPATPKVVL